MNKCVPRADDPHVLSLTTSDHVHLSALELGTGSDGILLDHEQGYNICSWLPLGTELARNGYHVMLFEYRNHGASQTSKDNDDLERDVRAALKELQRRGAQRILLGGASCGGSSAAVVAPHVRRLVGLLILSSPAHCGPLDAERAVRHVTVPSFFAASPGDMEGALVREVTTLYRASAATDKTLRIDHSGFHGTDMLNRAAHPKPLHDAVVAFINRAFGR